MNVMRQWIAIIVLFVASASIAVCSEMEAGNATFDLGDGYKSSFVLPDIGTEYVPVSYTHLTLPTIYSV